MNNLEYEDRYLKARIEKIVERQAQGDCLVELYSKDYGLPSLSQDGGIRTATASHYSGHSYEVFRDDAGGAIGYADYANDIGVYVFTPVPGAVLPPSLANNQKHRIAEVEVDEASRTATILLDEDMLTFTDVEVWSESYSLLKSINRELKDADAKVIAWKLKRVPDETGKAHLFKTGAPNCSNNQVNVVVSGYATTEYSGLSYIGIVGHKTAINSVWATILQSKPLNLYGAGTTYQPLNAGDGKYMRVMSPMPDYDAHHCAIISNQAIPGKWTPDCTSIYILRFMGGESIESQFVNRLNESLSTPILPEWGASLMKTGALKGIVRSLKTSGDCLEGIQIQLDADWWNKLIEDLLLVEELTV